MLGRGPEPITRRATCLWICAEATGRRPNSPARCGRMCSWRSAATVLPWRHRVAHQNTRSTVLYSWGYGRYRSRGCMLELAGIM